ncbi:YkgJ family cysteine cluster protein [Paraburkholderia lycopersici]|uniref:YkgJ family cysteine cluster protein n=1 Tax=Paraburkholderia lycopersici TaxID=416944 RepID=UPI000B8361CB|nr:YkgJ family cysteine cluster protein [Paraburkholderia lycopersici]
MSAVFSSDVSAPACRPGCGACCIAPSITTPIPGMADGKPAGVRCVQLTADNRCKLFGDPRRPAVCGNLVPSIEMCGENRGAAISWLARLEMLTSP